MLIVYDTLAKGEYPYVDGTISFGDYGETLKPFRGFLLKGKNFDVYKNNKTDLRESILSRVHKEDENPAPLVVTTKLGINADYVNKGLLVLFTTDGAMMVTPTEEGYKLFLQLGEQTFAIGEDGFSSTQDEDLSTVHWFTVDQLKQGINADDGIANAVSRNDGWENYFTYKFHITPDGDIVVRSVHNFMGGVMIDEEGEQHNETSWNWYVLTEDGRRRRMSSRVGKYQPTPEQIEKLIKESDYSVVRSDLEEYEREHDAYVKDLNKELEAKEEAAKASKTTKAKAKTKRSGATKTKSEKASDGRAKVSRDAAASFLAAVNAIATEGQED